MTVPPTLAMAEANAKADLAMQGGFGGHGHGHVHFPNKVGQVGEFTAPVAVGVMMMFEFGCVRAVFDATLSTNMYESGIRELYQTISLLNLCTYFSIEIPIMNVLGQYIFPPRLNAVDGKLLNFTR